uniref:Uncharacterized protein n=1 Tax=Oryza sativa subsp. japonica TaxID=39947 RepID=Q656B4_ORYSJ|nr:hypothetical protein [Oryza sativa Japonica Group]BAD45353.1 hypothetical protein [Oryza sativa Japonica Group]
MATDVAVQAVGPATSTSSNMIHRQRRRIFLDYASLFSDNYVLLRQFFLYAVLAPSSASSSSTIAAIVSPSSSLARLHAPLVHDALLCVHDHSTAPHALPAAQLSRHQLLDFGYIDHGYSTHGFINHGYSTHGFIDHGSLGSFALATSTTAQRAIIRIEHSCRFFSPVQVSTLLTLGLQEDNRIYGS